MAIVRTRLISFTTERVASLRKIRLGNESDNMVERLRFALPIIAEHQTATLVITGRADLVRLNYDDEDGYYVDLTAEIVGPDGETEAYVRIDGNSGEAWSSNPFRLITGALPDVDEEIEQRFPGAVETMLAEIEKHRGEMRDMESRDDELSYQIRAFSPDFSVSGPAPTCRPLAGDPLTVVSQIEIRQEGSGDPSPSNVRPIVRHSQVSLTITDDEGQRVITHELATPVIRGGYNWATGEVKSNVWIRDIGAAAAVNTGTSSTGIRYVNTHNGGKVPTALLACNRYKVTTSLPTESGYIRIVGGSIYIYDNAIDFANPSAAYAGTEVVEPAAETVVQDTPTEVLAGKGVNTIVSSTGETEVSGKGVLDVYSKEEVDEALDMLAGAVQEVDETLTKAGAAADAKVVGERFSELSEENAKTETALANMTVEGFRRVGGYENVKDKAELHAGKFVSTGAWDSSAKKTKIKFFDSAAFNYYALTVAEGERYKIKTWCGGTLYGCLLVNATEHIIADYPKPMPSVADNYEIEITIPSGVTTLYANETVSQAEKFAIEKENLSVPMFEKNDDHLFGKKLACVGDSITEATNPDGGYFKNYAELAAERHNMTVYKDGKSGSTMANIESNIPPFSAERYLNVPSDFDILTIWFGWNDSAYATVGTIDDTEDMTYYGAYKKVLEHFITTYPTKKIGLIVPYGNASVEPFRVAVRALSEMYGVPCLDLADGKQCSLLWGTANDAQLARRAALTYDGTHPNQTGHEYLSTMYEEFIKRL